MNSDVMGDLHEPYLAEITDTLNSPGTNGYRKIVAVTRRERRRSQRQDLCTTEAPRHGEKQRINGPSSNCRIFALPSRADCRLSPRLRGVLLFFLPGKRKRIRPLQAAKSWRYRIRHN